MLLRTALLTIALAAPSFAGGGALPPFLDSGAAFASLDLGPMRQVDVSLSNPIPVRRLHVEAFGPSCGPSLISAHVSDGGSFGHVVEVARGGLLAVSLRGDPASDLLLRLYGPSGRLVAVSDGLGADHALAVRLPADGAWRLEVEGTRVPSGWAEFDLVVDLLQGGGVEVTGVPSGPVAANEPVPLSVYAATAAAGCGAPRILLVYGAPGGESRDLTLTLRAVPPMPRLSHRVAATTAAR